MSLILLAGGKGKRIDADKAFLRFKGKFLIEVVIDKLNGLFSEIIIVANEVERFGFLAVKAVSDIVSHKEDLSGYFMLSPLLM